MQMIKNEIFDYFVHGQCIISILIKTTVWNEIGSGVKCL